MTKNENIECKNAVVNFIEQYLADDEDNKKINDLSDNIMVVLNILEQINSNSAICTEII